MRTRLLAVVLAALAVALLAATVGFNILLGSMSARDADSLLRQRVATERSLIAVRNGKLQLTEHFEDRAADSRLWILEGTRALEEPPTRPETAQAVLALTHGPSRAVTIASLDERLRSQPILAHGRRYGTIVVGVSLAPYEHTEHVALLASIAFAVALLLAVAAASWWLLRSALRPVARMTAQAAAWIDSDLDSRFRLGEPHDELTRLAWTLDQLLDRIAASLRHERLLSAELSHELRTPLAKLRAEAELALRRPRTPDDYVDALRGVIANADRIEGIVQTLLAAAEQEGAGRGVADADAVAQLAVGACAPLAAAEGVRLELEPAPDLRVGVDAAFAERVLHPVLDNACRYAHRRVHISLGRANGAVVFRVDDDGPGVDRDERELIFEPATRGSAGRSARGGAGLGLALARRLARSVAGDVEVAEPEGAGARFVVRLPAA